MTRSTNINTAYQQPQRRQLPPGTRHQQQPMTGERSSTRASYRGPNPYMTPPQQQPIPRRPQDWMRTDAVAADTIHDADDEDEDEIDDPVATARYPRIPSSVVPYRRTMPDYPYTGERPTRASSLSPERRRVRPGTPDDPETAADPRPAPRLRHRRWHPLLYVGLGLLIMVLAYLLFGAVSSWWQTTVDGWQYGYPRTFQTDAVVGHHDSPANPSHFIAINVHSHIEVIEFPGGDVTHARIYVISTLIGSGQDLVLVTLSFRDVTGDGKPDMIVSAGGTIVVFINENDQFRPLKPSEQVTL